MLNDNIKTIRKNKGFTQEELAIRLSVTRQTISKWEKGLSVPDAALLEKMAEVLEVPVTELLGSGPAVQNEPADSDALVEQLARINEQMAVKNRRAGRIWKIVAIVLIIMILVPFTMCGLGMFFRATPNQGEAVGETTWTYTEDNEEYSYTIEYDKSHFIMSTEGDTVFVEAVGLEGVSDADEAKQKIEEYAEAHGGTVEVTYQEGQEL